MAQLLSNERPIIEFELSSSTPEDQKWVKAYGRTELPDIAAMLEASEKLEDQTKLIYVITSRLLVDWSWYSGEEKAPITSETIALIDSVDFLEIANKLGVNDVLSRLLQLTPSKSKKKNSSATSSASKKRVKAKQ